MDSIKLKRLQMHREKNYELINHVMNGIDLKKKNNIHVHQLLNGVNYLLVQRGQMGKC